VKKACFIPQNLFYKFCVLRGIAFQFLSLTDFCIAKICALRGMTMSFPALAIAQDAGVAKWIKATGSRPAGALHLMSSNGSDFKIAVRSRKSHPRRFCELRSSEQKYEEFPLGNSEVSKIAIAILENRKTKFSYVFEKLLRNFSLK